MENCVLGAFAVLIWLVDVTCMANLPPESTWGFMSVYTQHDEGTNPCMEREDQEVQDLFIHGQFSDTYVKTKKLII